MATPKTHVSDKKKRKVDELAGLMSKKTIMVISIKGVPAAQYLAIKKQLRSKAEIKVAKKSTVNHALEKAKAPGLEELEKYVVDGTAILFSDEDAFEISGILSEEKTPAKAKAGQEAPEDIEIKAGPTDLMPGPDISALSSVGLIPKVEDGKIAIVKDAVIVKAGEVIDENKAAILAKLDITPFEIGLEPIAACMEGKVYADIKIDKEEMLENLLYVYGRALPFAVEVGYVNDITIDFMLAKAAAHEGVVTRIVTGEPEPVAAAPAESTTETQTQEETKKEEPAGESAAGLASLF